MAVIPGEEQAVFRGKTIGASSSTATQKAASVGQNIPAAAWVTLISANPSLMVSPLLDGTAPVVTSGYGGWVEVARPRRKALLDWQGVSPLRLSFGMIFDAFDSAPDNVEQDCIDLERMAMMGANNQRPPTIRISDGGKMPHSDVTWVIDTLTWGDQIRERETGNRLRAVVSIVLVELVEDGIIGKLSPATSARNASSIRGGNATPVRIVVKKGDTLTSLAAYYLGSADKWKQLATANGLRDSKGLVVGSQLRIP